MPLGGSDLLKKVRTTEPGLARLLGAGAAAELQCRADKAYQGAGHPVRVPFRGRRLKRWKRLVPNQRLTVAILEAGSWSGEVLLPIHWGDVQPGAAFVGGAGGVDEGCGRGGQPGGGAPVAG